MSCGTVCQNGRKIAPRGALYQELSRQPTVVSHYMFTTLSCQHREVEAGYLFVRRVGGSSRHENDRNLRPGFGPCNTTKDLFGKLSASLDYHLRESTRKEKDINFHTILQAF